MIDEDDVAGPHLADRANRLRISHAVPTGASVALEVVERVGSRFGLGKKVIRGARPLKT